jgi:hypothetical protein
LTNPDSAASAGRNLEVLRGLSELELLKLLGQLQEQGSAPVLPPTSGAPEEVGWFVDPIPDMESLLPLSERCRMSAVCSSERC